MKLDVNNLPQDIKLLHRIIADLLEEMGRLRNQLILLKKRYFGKSSEKLNRQVDEFEETVEDYEIGASKIIGAISDYDYDDDDGDKDDSDDEDGDNSKSKKRPKRQKLPEHLESIDEILNPDPKCPKCNGENFRKISDDISETLEYIPSSFKVIRHIRPRCVCTNCETIVQAYPPSKAIDKGKAGPGLLAHILVQKYCNHLPLYRQSQVYEREGIVLSRSTMASWAGQCARLLEPLVDELKKVIFSASQIHGDDTPVKVLAPGFGKTKTGRIWTYVLDGRPHGDNSPPTICYFYSPDRKGIRPKEHLKNFTGILHADAYSGYDRLYKDQDIEDEAWDNATTKDPPNLKLKSQGFKESGPTITEAACWAHTRRKFYEVVVINDKARIAQETLEQIAVIYKIEEEIRGQDPQQRQKVRQEKSKELVEQLFASWKKHYTQLSRKSQTAKAIAYALNNRKALMRFLDNGKIEIDNNAAERALRAVAVGRKNWLFAGSDWGGKTAAAIYSLIETAKLNNINPWKYLNHVLGTIQDHNSAKLAELLPWNVKLD